VRVRASAAVGGIDMNLAFTTGDVLRGAVAALDGNDIPVESDDASDVYALSSGGGKVLSLL
jgi:hypothetical protein